MRSLDGRDIASNLMNRGPLATGMERRQLDGATLLHGPIPVPFMANVSEISASETDLGELIATARRWFAERGRTEFSWFVGPGSTTPNLVELLKAHGASDFTTMTAMWLDHEPPHDAGFDIREAVDADDEIRYLELVTAAGGRGPLTPDELDHLRRNPPARETYRRKYLAYHDDQPVAAGGLMLTDQGWAGLIGGATTKEFRGNGYYRALVHHRWGVAKTEGALALAVQASSASAPILGALGFQTVAEVRVLIQRVSAD